MDTILLIIGMILITYSLLLEAEDLISKIMLNGILFICGLYITFYSMKLLNWF